MIWREGYTGAGAPCARYGDNMAKGMTEIVRFDEHENTAATPYGPIICAPVPQQPIGQLPETSSSSTSSSVFPPFTTSGDLGGGMYMSASNCRSPLSTPAPRRAFPPAAAHQHI